MGAVPEPPHPPQAAHLRTALATVVTRGGWRRARGVGAVPEPPLPCQMRCWLPPSPTDRRPAGRAGHGRRMRGLAPGPGRGGGSRAYAVRQRVVVRSATRLAARCHSERPPASGPALVTRGWNSQATGRRSRRILPGHGESFCVGRIPVRCPFTPLRAWLRACFVAPLLRMTGVAGVPAITLPRTALVPELPLQGGSTGTHLREGARERGVAARSGRPPRCVKGVRGLGTAST